MTFELKEEITDYVSQTYSPVLQSEIRASFTLFDAFDYEKPYVDVQDILFDPDAEDPDKASTGFLSMVESGLDALLRFHDLVVTPETTLTVKNQILAALLRIQYLEDPTPMLRTLETDLSNEEQFARLVSDLSLLDEARILEALVSVDVGLLDRIRAALYAREEAVTESEDAQKEDSSVFFENLRTFFHVHGTGNLAGEMLRNEMRPGLKIEQYIPYVGEYLKDLTTGELARDLLALFIMSKDTFQTPLESYRKYSEHFIGELDRIQATEAAMMPLITAMSQFNGAQDVARSLSSTVHPA
jgi:hypothetical protein